MSAQRRFIALTVIMLGVCGVVLLVVTSMLYRSNVTEHREQLLVTAQSQARTIEAVARYDLAQAEVLVGVNSGYDPTAATLKQMAAAHGAFGTFGKTGEFTLARQSEDSISFVWRQRFGESGLPKPIALDSDLAEPMRLALGGESGTVIGLDYRGSTVLAAYEPIALLDLGLVVKMDLAEVRAPYIRSSLLAGGIALILAALAA